MGSTECGAATHGVDGRTIEVGPDPARPGLVHDGVEPVEKLDLQAHVLVCERSNAEAALSLGTADIVPRHEALRARHAVGCQYTSWILYAG